MDQSSDEQLVELYLRHKDETALEQLVERYLPLIFGFVRRYTGREDDASDITQEVFVKVWKNLEKFDTSKNFRCWIFTIAKRTAIDWLNKKNALPFSAIGNAEDNFMETLADEAPSILEKLAFKETFQELALAISKLPSSYGSVVELRIKEELTFREISKIFKEPLNTVKSRYRRGVVLLQKILLHQN